MKKYIQFFLFRERSPSRNFIRVFIGICLLNPMFYFTLSVYELKTPDINQVHVSNGSLVTFRSPFSGKSLIERGIKLDDGNYYICRIVSTNTGTECYGCKKIGATECQAYDISKQNGMARVGWYPTNGDRVVYFIDLNGVNLISYEESKNKYLRQISEAKIENIFSLFFFFLAIVLLVFYGKNWDRERLRNSK